MKNLNMSRSFLAKTFLLLSLLVINLFAYGASTSIAQAVDDSAITTQIKAKYAQNPLLSVFDISVQTNNGVVELSGFVDSDTQYERAIVLAENTDGVKDVNVTQLTIRSSQKPLQDTIITAKIKGLLLKNKLVGDENEANPWPIHVETRNGVVYLTGRVANKSQKDKVIQTAKLVDGVKSVKSELIFK